MLWLNTTIHMEHKSCNTGTQTILNEVGASQMANSQKLNNDMASSTPNLQKSVILFCFNGFSCQYVLLHFGHIA